MLKFMKYYKKYWYLILVVFALQSMRAFGVLEIPTYMKNIVDIGLQNSGVENPIPEVLSEETYNELLGYADMTQNEELRKRLELSYLKAGEMDYTEKEIESIVEVYTDFDYKVDRIIISDLIEDDENENLNILIDELSFPLAVKYLQSDNFDPEAFEVEGDIPVMEDNVDFTQLNPAMLMEQYEQAPVFIKSYLATNGVVVEYEDNFGVNMDDYQMDYLISNGIIMLGLSFMVLVSVVVAYFFISFISTDFSHRLRKDMYEKTLSFSNKEYENFATSSLITRTTNDIVQVNNATSLLLQVAVYAPILGVFGTIMTYKVAPNMVGVIFSSILALCVTFLLVVKIVVPRFKRVQELTDKLNQVSREMLSGILVVRAFGNEEMEEERFSQVNKDITANNLVIARIMSTIFPIIMIIFNFTTIAVVYFGAVNVDAGNMGIGEIMAVIQYAANILFAFMMLSMISFSIPRAQISSKRINEVLKTSPQILDGGENVGNVTGVVEFKNVTFNYSGKENTENVLDGINFTARPSEVTAIIGSTGSGKSSIVNLIPRFYDVTAGEILIDGKNINTFNLKDLRSNIAVVAQKAFLFSGTIRSNIEVNGSMEQDEIEQVAYIAESKDFIESKEDGYDSEISQGGKNVSGGQRQRLSIARALAKKAPIIIFDDSFSALDYKTDARLRKKLDENMKNTTTIIVAQRISTIKNADQIIVLDEGKIVGKGTHKDLLQNCTIYNEIASSQLSKEELGYE